MDALTETRPMLVAAVDVGSSVVKAVIIDADGQVRGHAAVRTQMTSRKPGAAELDPVDLIDKPLETLATAVARSGSPPESIAAIAVTGARGTILALDRASRPLGPAVMWTDSRSTPHLGPFIARCGGMTALTARIGIVPDTTLSAATVLRWSDDGSSVETAAACFAGPQAVTVQRLTGTFATDLTHAAHYGFASLEGTDWDPELCAAAGIAPARLPRLVSPGAVVGPLTRESARHLGLRAGIPVVAAGSDAACYKLGAGLSLPGQGTVSIGTAASIAVLVERPRTDRQGLLSCTPAALPGLWEVFGMQPSGGAMLDWLHALVTSFGDASIEDLIREADALKPGADGLTAVPYLMGAGLPQSRTATAMLAGIRPGHGRAHLTRSILEGVAFSLCDILGAMEAAGCQPSLLRMVGGAARSPIWAQIVADVLGVPIETVAADEPALLGAASIGAVTVGLHRDIREAVGAMTGIRRRHVPCAEAGRAYVQAYTRFREAAAGARAFPEPTSLTEC